MTPLERALEYLQTAEAGLLSYMTRLSEAAVASDEEEFDVPDMIPVFGAVLANLARAEGVIEAQMIK